MFKFVDLFCGLGGFRISVEQICKKLNMECKCVLSSDIKKSAIKTYKRNFSETPFGDISQIDTKDIPDFDLLCAGFPCQPFSSAGKRMGFEDTRGTLFFEIARILKDKKPKYFILENVEGLSTHNNGNTLKTIYHILTNDLGYYVEYKVLNSIEFGLPQSRKRLYIIGAKKQINENLLENSLYFNRTILNDIIDKIPNEELYIKNDFTKKLLSYYQPKDLWGKSISDKRGGIHNIHSWDISLRGEVSDDEKHIMETISQERRKRYVAQEQNVPWSDGIGLTKQQIKKFIFLDDEILNQNLNDLVQKGYLKETYPKINKKLDYTKEKNYDLSTGKLSFPVTYIFDNNWVAPTLTATDLSHMAIADNIGLRRVSKNELKKLFGYPNNYNLDDCNLKECYDLFGNTICVNVIENILYNLLLF